MDDETHPPPPQTRPTSANRARPSMGGSGLFGTQTIHRNNTITHN